MPQLHIFCILFYLSKFLHSNHGIKDPFHLWIVFLTRNIIPSTLWVHYEQDMFINDYFSIQVKMTYKLKYHKNPTNIQECDKNDKMWMQEVRFVYYPFSTNCFSIYHFQSLFCVFYIWRGFVYSSVTNIRVKY